MVDDDPDAVDLLRSYLEHAGLDTGHSPSGNEALRCLQESPPDLVLLDVQMPGLDGFETLAELRAIPRLRGVPVIFLSSFDRPNLKVRALDMGADDYVVKPFNSAELVARVRAVLRRGRRMVEPSAILEGDLVRFPLPLLLQTLSLVGRTATVHFPERRERPERGDLGSGEEAQELRRQGLWAWVLMAEGRFHAARFGPHCGRAALGRLLLCRSGRFETVVDQAIEPITGEGIPIDNLILQLLVEFDESCAMLEPVCGLDQPVRALPTASASLQDWIAAGSFSTPRQILIRSRRTFAETVAVMASACRQGELALVEGEVSLQ